MKPLEISLMRVLAHLNMGAALGLLLGLGQLWTGEMT
jgi:hypothetical protein